MSKEKIILSFSKISTYMQCGIKYELKYAKGIEVPTSPFKLLGRSIHKTIENLYSIKEKQDELKIQDIKDIALETVKQQYEEIKNAPAPGLLIDNNLEEKEVITRIEKSVVKMAAQYFDARVKKTTPLMIEQEFFLSLKDEAPKYCVDYDGSLDDVYVIGYIDLVDSSENIIDLKTSTRKPQLDIADKSDQLTIYTLGYVIETGMFPSKVTLDYIIHDWLNSPDKIPLIMTLSSQRTKKDIQKFLDKLIRVIKGIKSGVFLPPDPNSWACTRCAYKYLGYCKFGN